MWDVRWLEALDGCYLPAFWGIVAWEFPAKRAT